MEGLAHFNYLKELANYDASKERKELTLSKLCSMIENEEIVLPIFQTYIRWTPKKVVDLLNYQLLAKSPVAPISMNVIDDPTQVIEQITFFERKLIPTNTLMGKLSVVDGQQRLSSNYKFYIDHPDVQNIVLDLKKAKFLQLKPDVATKEITIKPHQIPVGKLYHKDSDVFFEYVNKNSFLKKDKIKDLLSSIRKKHEQYYYVVNLATNLSREEQMNWFEVLNLAGSQVTADMVYLTDLLVKGVDFYTEYANIFGNVLDSYGLGDLFPRKSAEISIPLAALNPAYFKISGKEQTLNSAPFPSDTKAKSIGSLEVEQIREIINITLGSLDVFLHYVDTKDLKDHLTRIDLITYVVGLFVEYGISSMESLSETQQEYIDTFIKEVEFVNQTNQQRRIVYKNLVEKFPTNVKENATN